MAQIEVKVPQLSESVAEATLRDVWQRVGFVAPAHPGLKGQ